MERRQQIATMGSLSLLALLGFAAFFLEGVGKSGNENYVKGKFVQMITTGEIGTGASGYGLYGSTLIE